MASFQTKIGWERLRKRENKKKSFRWVPTRPVIENFKKIVKKFKNLENTIMASFQAKICWGRLWKRKNKKKIVTMSSYPTCNKEFQKNNKKKKKNTIMASFQTKIGWERLRKRKNKKKSFRWVPTRPIIENLKKK